MPEGIRNNLGSIDDGEKDLTGKDAALTPWQYLVLCYLREGWS
jgi:hypothetical protein